MILSVGVCSESEGMADRVEDGVCWIVDGA